MHAIVSVHAMRFDLFDLTLLPRSTPIVSTKIASDKKSSSPRVECMLTRAVCRNKHEQLNLHQLKALLTKGVSSDGFITIVHPTAKAGATWSKTFVDCVKVVEASYTHFPSPEDRVWFNTLDTFRIQRVHSPHHDRVIPRNTRGYLSAGRLSMNIMHIHLPTYTYRFVSRECKFDFVVHFQALQSFNYDLLRESI